MTNLFKRVKTLIIIALLCKVKFLIFKKMAIKKQFIKTKPVCKVTFSIEAKEAKTVSVIGDFNNWNPAEGELSKLKNGTFKGLVEMPKDASYEFKYLIDGTSYINDNEADSYKWNAFANAENSVVEV